MIWGCYAASGLAQVAIINGKMKLQNYYCFMFTILQIKCICMFKSMTLELPLKAIF